MFGRRAEESTILIDGQRCAVNQIHWLIKQRERINRDEPIKQKIRRPITSKSPSIIWKDIIIKSRSPTDRLPNASNKGDAEQVCEIKSKLDSNILIQKKDATEKKQKRFWDSRSKKEPQTFEYEILVFIGSGNLKFEVQYEGTVVGEKSIPVELLITRDFEGQENADQKRRDEDEGLGNGFIL